MRVHWDWPVILLIPDEKKAARIADPAEALDFLLHSWPGHRGQLYRLACSRIAQTLDNPDYSQTSYLAFRAAVIEAGITMSSS